VAILKKMEEHLECKGLKKTELDEDSISKLAVSPHFQTAADKASITTLGSKLSSNQ
jgi:hypothetical protein